MNIINELFGTNDLASFAVSLGYAYLGAIISILIHTTNRVPSSPNSPFKFDWSYLLSDNVKRIVLNVILIFVTVRFYPELKGMFSTIDLGGLNGNEAGISHPMAIFVGVSYDKLLELFRNIGMIDKKNTPQ